MLEEKIRNVSARMTKVILPLTVAVSLAYVAGCGDEKPSKYCCEAMKCGEEGNPPVCDGSGDDCYCRSKTCCEESACNYGYSCVENGIGDCMCERDYSNKYLEAKK